MSMRSLVLLLLTAMPALAQDLPPGLVSAELMPGWVTQNGTRMTALRLELEPGWKTYWRSPGDAGIPPSFDWSGSQNIGRVQIHWPRPEVIDSGGERTLGYHDELILPIELTPAKAGEIEVRARVELGLCLDICVPGQLELVAGPALTAPEPRIEAALTQEPDRVATRPQCHIRPIKDGMQVTAMLPGGLAGTGAAAAMELLDDRIWVSEPEVTRQDGAFSATADFVASSGKPFEIDPDELRLTLIEQGDAIEFLGCDETVLPATQ
ncbi:DsbC/DsbD-like thiol-disulfide interchange protein [Paracoccus sulfuroxidans]|uniref:DsbC/DsbD-like thiol-disulfide interchange protein n=2 Tax=Paracoccus sulfuroxidans TaxID=384678 RepID=A0A562NFW3_9RHOB|nr:DsbC/DsbD-like thiol-disulfide interchange protein [Paracoccus sulfuroxidans]